MLRHSLVLRCSICSCVCHILCIPLSRPDYEDMLLRDHSWICTSCSGDILPFNGIADENDFREALYELYSDFHIDMEKVSKMMFNPFTVNDRHNVPLFDIDPDSHYFNDISCAYAGNSNYMNEEEFNGICKRFEYNCFSVYHANARSLPANIIAFEAYLGSLNHEFTVIGMTETWLKDSNIDLYTFTGYTHIGAHRIHKSGGGVSLFVRTDIQFQHRSDLSVLEDVIECVFIEIDKSIFQHKRNILVGVIYRPPNTCPEVFLWHLEQEHRYPM